MKKAEILKTIKESPASMFTKDDIYALLEKLDTLESEKTNIIECLRISIQERLSHNAVYDAVIDCIDKDSASFSLNFDRIVLDEIDIDSYRVQDNIIEKVMDIVEIVVDDLARNAGGNTCDGNCGDCNTPCNEIEEEIINSQNQNNNE